MLVACRCGNTVQVSQDSIREGICWCDSCGALINLAEAPRVQSTPDAPAPPRPAPRQPPPKTTGPPPQPRAPKAVGPPPQPRAPKPIGPPPQQRPPKTTGPPPQPRAPQPRAPQARAPQPRAPQPRQEPRPAPRSAPPADAPPPSGLADAAAAAASSPAPRRSGRKQPVIAQGIGGPTTKRPDPRRRAPHPLLPMLAIIAATTAMAIFTAGPADVDANAGANAAGVVPGQVDLIGYWPLDGNANDSGPYRLNGKLVGGPKFVPGRIGKAAEFNGKNRIEIRGHAAFDAATDAVTIAAWVKLPNTPQHDWAGIVTRGDATWRLSLADKANGRLSFSINSGSPNDYAASTATSLNDDKWHHVVGVYSGVTVDLYVDGQLAGTNSRVSSAVNRQSRPIWISGNADKPGRELIGAVDDVRVYQGAMTDAQVRDLYQQSN
ncbi:MAG: hypothetical protein GC159_19800 [Phycisphaera sp.]|nr:hypothetical protein [Phycisphaera sp.]